MIFLVFVKSPLPFVQMLSSDFSAFRLSKNWIDFVSGCCQRVVRYSFLDNEFEFLDINLYKNSFWVFIIKFQVFVISVEVNSENLTSVYFPYQSIKYCIWVFHCNFKILSFLGIINDRNCSAVMKIKDINDKFKFFLFWWIPFEDCLWPAW